MLEEICMRFGNKKNLRYLIIGGDDRFIELANLYKKNRYDVSIFGFELADIKTIKHYDNIDEAVDKSNIIICPLPLAKDGTKLNTYYSKNDIEIEELLNKVTDEKILFVGAVNNYSKTVADKYKVSYIDYYIDESYQILNTIPTAEGALAIMINETSITLFESNVLILGYGRIGKVLSEYIKALGANVYVEARKEKDLTWITSKRMKAVPLSNLKEYIEDMDIIVNTIPSLIIDQSLLDMVKKDAFLLDLASKPGGINFEYAKEKGIKTIHALSIPGKIASKSAAQYIYDTINKLLDQI